MKFPQVGKPVGGETTLAIPPTWNITSRPLDQPPEYSSLNIQKPEIKQENDIHMPEFLEILQKCIKQYILSFKNYYLRI